MQLLSLSDCSVCLVAGVGGKLSRTACPPGVKITRVGAKISRDSLPPGGQPVQGGKINCYTGTFKIACMIILFPYLKSAFKLVKLVFTSSNFSYWPFQSGTSSGVPEAFYRICTLDWGQWATP